MNINGTKHTVFEMRVYCVWCMCSRGLFCGHFSSACRADRPRDVGDDDGGEVTVYVFRMFHIQKWTWNARNGERVIRRAS